MILFSEHQKFKQIWIWIVLLSVTIGLLVVLIFHIIKEQGFIFESIGLIITLGISFLVYKSELLVTIDDTKINYKFSPFQSAEQTIPFSDIQKLSLIQYDPIKDYGGWGMKISATGKGRSYTISGNQGLLVLLKDGKQILFGTQQKELLLEVIPKINNKL